MSYSHLAKSKKENDEPFWSTVATRTIAPSTFAAPPMLFFCLILFLVAPSLAATGGHRIPCTKKPEGYSVGNCAAHYAIRDGATCQEVLDHNPGLDIESIKELNPGICCGSLDIGLKVCIADSLFSNHSGQS